MTTLAQKAPQRNTQHSKPDDQEPVLIAEWPIKRGEIARVSIENYKGTWLIDLRKWFEVDAGDWRATSKGLKISVKHLRRISAAMNEALEIASARGLIPADKGHGQ
jgi:hypothetical protein